MTRSTCSATPARHRMPFWSMVLLLAALPAGLIVAAPPGGTAPDVAPPLPVDGAQTAAGRTTAGLTTAGLTIEALIDIRHPSNPIWSPDSRSVAFMWERAGVSNLYVAPADGTRPPAAITTDGRQVGNPFWSADSRTIYFTREGQLIGAPATGGSAPRQVWPEMPGRGVTPSPDGAWVAYVAGAGRGSAGPGEIRVRSLADGSDRTVASFSGPIGGVAWTPDGRRLTFTSGGGGRRSIRHEQTPEYSGSKIIYTVNQNVPGDPAETYVVPLSGGTPARIDTGGGGGRGGPRWIDDTHVVFDRTSEFKRRTTMIADVTTGAVRTVREDVKTTFWSMVGGAGGGSQPSPDGRFIALLSDRDGWDHLHVLPASGGEAVQITRGAFEAWRPSWSPDSTRIAFDSNEGENPGRRHLYVATIGADPTRATIRQLTTGRGTNIDPAWSPDGTKLVYQHTDPQNSADLFVIDATRPGATPVRLTDSLPPSIDRAALVDPELVHYPGPDGKPVPAYLFVPKNLDRSRRHPAVVWIHGDGVNQNYDGWHVQRNYAVYYSFHQYLLQQGYVVLAPDYRGSIGYGSAWREGVYMDVGGKDFRDAALAGDYLETLDYVDGDRLGVWGLSYGGFFTLLAVTEMPERYGAAVNVAGVADYAMYYEDPYHGSWTESRIGRPDQHPEVYAQASPVSHVDRLVTPLLVLHGTADVNVPYLHSVRLIDELLKKGKGPLVEFMTYPGEFHYFTREHVLRDAWTRVDDFFARHLRPEGRPAAR
jgi:dipeptidyl aminopeptidase/acylaminoacyl peptidase